MERYDKTDIALCAMEETVTFSKATYFTANPPSLLIDSKTMEANLATCSWFEVEGMTTGKAQLLYSGPGSKYKGVPDELKDSYVLDHYMSFDWYGPANVVRGGICGATVVHQPCPGSILDGATIGFYCWDDGRHAVVPTLDEWELGSH